MNASSSPARFRVAVVLALGAVLAVMPLASLSHAQDTIVLRNGQKRMGKVTGVADGLVRIETQAASGVVQGTVPLAEVQSVNMQTPADFEAAQQAWKAGQAQQARAKLEPLVKNFNGLPASWVPEATLLLIDAQIETGDPNAAEQTLVEFQRNYPGRAESTGLMRAKIAVGRKNFVGAKPLLAPILEQSKTARLADTSQSVEFGQAHYLMGQIREREGDLSGALEDYLRASLLFFGDAAVAERARQRAEALIEKGVTVP